MASAGTNARSADGGTRSRGEIGSVLVVLDLYSDGLGHSLCGLHGLSYSGSSCLVPLVVLDCVTHGVF